MSEILSQHVRELLAQSGWTQKRLADELGVHPVTVSRYCTGDRSPARHYDQIVEMLTRAAKKRGQPPV